MKYLPPTLGHKSLCLRAALKLRNSPPVLLLLAGLLFALSFPSNILESHSSVWGGWLLSPLDRALQRGLPPLIFLFALPLLHALQQLRSLRQALIYGAFYGFSSYLFLSLWLLDYDWIAFILIPGIYLYYFSVFFGAYYLFLRFLQKHGLPEPLSYVFFALSWMLLEYFKSTGWVAYTYGSLLYSHYLWPTVMGFSRSFVLQNLSYILILTPAICLHALAHPNGRTLPLGTFKINETTNHKLIGRDKLLLIAPLLSVVTLYWGFTVNIETTATDQATGQVQIELFEPASKEIKQNESASISALPVSPDRLNIALLQHNVNSWQTEKDTNRQALDRLLEMSRRAEERNAELIIWSETAFVPIFRSVRNKDITPIEENIRDLKTQLAQAPSQQLHAEITERLNYFYSAHQELILSQELQQYLQQAKAMYLIGTNDFGQPDIFPGEQRWNLYNSVLLIQNGKILATYHKQRLVPFTEETKWQKQLPTINALLRRNGLAQYSPGTGSPVLTLAIKGKLRSTLKIYTMICYEDSIPLYWPQNLTTPVATSDFDILLSISNDSWSPSSVGGLQHLSSALSRAVEMKRYFLRGSTSGQTVAISPQGQLLGRLPPNIPAILYFRLPIQAAP